MPPDPLYEGVLHTQPVYWLYWKKSPQQKIWYELLIALQLGLANSGLKIIALKAIHKTVLLMGVIFYSYQEWKDVK